jgi:hypothetical protein
MAATKKATRELTVLKRAEVKKASTAYGVQPGDLIFLVQNDQEDVHVVTCRNNGNNTCTCKGNAQFHKKCYHITFCLNQTNIRRESAKLAPSFAAVKVPVWTMWLVESGVLTVPSKQVVSKPAQPAKIIDISTRGTLTTNRGFQLLRA